MMSSHNPYTDEPKPPMKLDVPVLLGTIALLAVVGLQTTALLMERGGLHDLRTSQDSPLEQGQKVRTQLDALAGGTAKLAQQGNAGAKAIVDDLQRQGIQIKPTP